MYVEVLCVKELCVCVKELCARVDKGACKESATSGRDVCEGKNFAFKSSRWKSRV